MPINISHQGSNLKSFFFSHKTIICSFINYAFIFIYAQTNTIAVKIMPISISHQGNNLNSSLSISLILSSLMYLFIFLRKVFLIHNPYNKISILKSTWEWKERLLCFSPFIIPICIPIVYFSQPCTNRTYI